MRNLTLRALAAVLCVGAAATGGSAAIAQEPDPSRLSPLVVRSTGDYELEVVAAGEGFRLTADIRRTDGVGNSYPGLDGYGYITSSSWGAIAGRRCLAVSSVGTLGGPNTVDRDIAYGLVGTKVDRVELVLTDSTEIVARRGEATHEGLRGWIAVAPAGTTVERAVAYDRSGAPVATVENLDQSAEYGRSATCR